MSDFGSELSSGQQTTAEARMGKKNLSLSTLFQWRALPIWQKAWTHTFADTHTHPHKTKSSACYSLTTWWPRNIVKGWRKKKTNLLGSLWKLFPILYLSVLLYLHFMKWENNIELCIFEYRQWIWNWFFLPYVFCHFLSV